MLAGSSDKQAFLVEVGPVDKELVVDAVRVWFARDNDEPEVEASWVWFRFFYGPVLMGSVR